MQTFRKFDSVIKDLKTKVRKIDKFILLLSLVVCALIVVVFALSDHAVVYQLGAASILLFSWFILIYSVF